MKLVIFGLTISSSWGNGHATLWRGLCTALGRLGHEVVFFERDVSYYAAHRDVTALTAGELVLYPDWPSVLPLARQHLAEADVAIVTSYCPDGRNACQLVQDSNVSLKAFYDLDTPVTLTRLEAGEEVVYLPTEGLHGFDLVLSYTGGEALGLLKSRLGARRVAPLYGSVDPSVHFPVSPVNAFQGDLSYLGTYAADRQKALQRLFIDPARLLPKQRFIIGGAQYPAEFPWTSNIYFVNHLPPGDHPAFFCSSRLTLNITRKPMADLGFCPSGRLFEAAACGAPILSDTWEGLDQFFEPGEEILTATSTEEALAVLQLPEDELARIGSAAREKVLSAHTSEHRAQELVAILEQTDSTVEIDSKPEPVEA